MPLDAPVTSTPRPAKVSAGGSDMNVDSSGLGTLVGSRFMAATLRLPLRTIVVILVMGAARLASAASVDGIPLHWTSAGTGPQTLMLVHGWTCDDSSWSSQVSALKGKYRV